MEVVSQPDGKPFVVDTDHGGHSNGNRGGSYGYSGGYDGSDWSRTAERVKDSQALQTAEFNSRAFSSQDTAGRQFAEAQVSTAGVSKDVAVLSRDVVISEGRLLIQHCKTQEGIAILSKELALTEARLNLVAAQNAAAAAECCCEIKALILEQNGATRLLIKDNLIESLKDQLAVARASGPTPA